MEKIIVFIGIVLALIVIIGSSLGFNLKTRRGKFIIFCGFACGFLMGLDQNLITSIGMGIMVTLLTIISGLAMFRINSNSDRFK